MGCPIDGADQVLAWRPDRLAVAPKRRDDVLMPARAGLFASSLSAVDG